jgi:hypothetical protein
MNEAGGAEAVPPTDNSVSMNRSNCEKEDSPFFFAYAVSVMERFS